jgi:hypothetical protein
MKVTVKDCLQLDVFKECTVVAGERNLQNRVKNISVLDAQSPEEAAQYCSNYEELVLTTFSGMRGNVKAQCETVRVLAKANISGIVVFQRDATPEGTAYLDVIKTADEVGMPLIACKTGIGVDYSEVINEVMEKLLYGDNFKNSLINNTIFNLLNFERHSSFQQALHEAAVSNDFQLVLLSEEFNPVLTIETRHKTTIEEAIRKGREVAINSGDVYSLVEIDGVLTYWGAATIDGDRYYLLIVDNDDNYTAGEITKLAEIIELAMGMWKYTPERDAKTEFVKALIRGNRSLAYSLKDELQIKPQDIVSVFYVRGIDSLESDAIIDRYEEQGLVNVLKVNEPDECYGIIFKGDEKAYSDEVNEKTVCNDMFNELKEEKKGRIFHVTGVDDIECAADGFHVINESWSFVEYIFPYKRVFTKYELALVSNCISIKMHGGQLKKTFTELLTQFRGEDNKSKQLLDTLETFVLDAGMNSSKTAKFMGIHTNTVQYRLKKINEILGAEITGNRVIPGLTVALALQRLESASK